MVEESYARYCGLTKIYQVLICISVVYRYFLFVVACDLDCGDGFKLQVRLLLLINYVRRVSQVFVTRYLSPAVPA